LDLQTQGPSKKPATNESSLLPRLENLIGRLEVSQLASQSPSAREVFGNLPRGVIGAICETHHWAKAVCGGESEKVESRNGRFKVGGKYRSVLETLDSRQDIVAQKWQAT